MSEQRSAEVDFTLTLAELSRCCGVSAERILVLVGHGVIEPVGRDQRAWRFRPVDIERASCALRLEHDLGVNPAGAALAVDLLDEVRRLRRRVRLLEDAMF
jgi:chaperone modulatory protein CbpM